jgi:C-terminal processing protease CtpA/Prc
MEDYIKIGEKVIELIEKKYSYLAFKSEEYEIIKKGINNEMPNAKNDSQALEVLVKYLGLFEDGHINILNSENRQYHTLLTLKKNFENSVADSYLNNIIKIKPGKPGYSPIVLGELGDKLYIRISSFSNDFKDCFNELYSLEKLKELSNKEKFIIDLRSNCGGNSELGENLVSFLLGNSEPKTAFYLQERKNESDPKELSDLKEVQIKSNYSHNHKNLTVLIGPTTYSSAELTAMKLLAVPEAKSIGDVSGGGSGCPIEYELNNKFKIRIPSWICRKSNKELLQNKGIIPNILVPFNETIKEGKDLALEAAINLL